MKVGPEVDAKIAADCPRCSFGHTNTCRCRKDCGHPRCSKK